MKKPKKKKLFVKVAVPKSVPSAFTRVYSDFKYSVSLGKFWQANQPVLNAWCTSTFAPGTWHLIWHPYPGTLWFIRESDATMFRLRWGV